ncbi:MAG TPA: ComF family protein [Candidatus Angelobacter sp.]
MHCKLVLNTAILSLATPALVSFRRVVFSSSGGLTRDLTPPRGSLARSGRFGVERALRATAESLFSVLFPSDCRICSSSLTRISALPVCGPCLERITSLSGILCGVCGEKLFSKFVETAEGPLCGMCRRAAPPFRRALAYGAYDGALRDLIHLLKYQQIKPVAPLLARLLVGTLAGVALPESLVVVPVPLFKRKLRERGFNQAEEIARAFVRRSRLRGIQLDTSSLARARETASQTGLTRHQRRANLRGAFAVVRPERIADRSVLVIDDVMTTGATASECSRVLLRAGAKQVFVATVARATREVEIHLNEAMANAARA